MGHPGAAGAAVVGLVVACAGPPAVAPVAAVRDGISIAVYEGAGGAGYGVVDDRRWIDVDGRGDSETIELADIAPDIALAQLTIDPLGGGLELGSCVRAHPIAAPGPQGGVAVRCAVRARRGRYLVRLLYTSSRVRYRLHHDLVMTEPDRVTIASRFTVATPARRARAELTLFEGVPGTERPPRELARAIAALDGGTAVIDLPPRTIAAQLRRIYDGAVHRPGDPGPRDSQWGRDSQPAVWVWLELGDAPAPRGDVRVHLGIAGEPVRDVEVPPAGRRSAAGALRLALWIDGDLQGKRERWSTSPRDAALTDRLAVSVANTGATAREVWVEEPLRPARRRTLVRAWPGEPRIARRTLRLTLTVPPGGVERGGCEIQYDL